MSKLKYYQFNIFSLFDYVQFVYYNLYQYIKKQISLEFTEKKKVKKAFEIFLNLNIFFII